MVGRDLCRRRSVDSLFPEMVFDLFTSRAGSLQIFLRVVFYFRLSVLAALQFVAQLFQTQSQLGSIHRRGVALRHEHLVWLQSSHLFPIFETVLALGHVEDHGMSMKLGRSIAIDGPRGVVLESGGDEFSGRLRGMDIADPRLRVSFKLLKCRANALPMSLPHPIIAAYERCERYRLRRRECSVPPRAMLGAGHLSAKFAFIGSRNLMPHELLFGVRMLAFTQSCKVFGTNATLQPPLLGEPTLPLTVTLLIAAPIVLFLRGKLPHMVGLRLAGRQRFRDREHTERSSIVKWCSWQFVSHSIPFVFSQANASLGLLSGAPMVEPLTVETKSASIGWVGFFSGSAGAFGGTESAGFGAISGICRRENLGSLNRILPTFILHLWIKLGRGRPHSVVSLSDHLRENR